MAFDHQLESDRNPSVSILLRIPLLLLGIVLNYSIVKEIGAGNGGDGGSTTMSLERTFHNMIDQQLIRTNNNTQKQKEHVVGRKWSPSLRTIEEEEAEEDEDRQEDATTPTPITIEEAATIQESSLSSHVSSLFRSLSVSSISPRIISSVLRRYAFSLVRNVVFVAVIAVVHDKIDHTLPI
mmetsp:Transcript_47654/g.54031  ORF Transcript_47654/g.54031 Transcript_47654/m.54031 type:complete len:181 (+) Transcript_47654:234-776(+)